MRNKIDEIFENISNDELKQGILEIKEDGEKGFIRNGVVRKYAKITSEIIGKSVSLDLFMTELNLLRQASYRWAKPPKQKCKCVQSYSDNGICLTCKKPK
jgi:hypothetical protein